MKIMSDTKNITSKLGKSCCFPSSIQNNSRPSSQIVKYMVINTSAERKQDKGQNPVN